jgi:hypothetical protein
MNSLSLLSRQGHRLLQIGIVLIFYLAVEGFAIPYLGSPRIGLSVARNRFDACCCYTLPRPTFFDDRHRDERSMRLSSMILPRPPPFVSDRSRNVP